MGTNTLTTKAGAAEVVITPPVGVDMMGFGGRPSGCIGVHDDLYARALVIAGDDEASRVAIVSTDLCSLDFDIVANVRDGVLAETGIAADGLFLNTSHTHHGPVTISIHGLGYRNEDYITDLVQKLVHVVATANQRLTGARLFAGREPVQIGVNRRELRTSGSMVLGENATGAVDKEVRVLRVEAEEGTPIAVAFNHAAHAVCLGGANLLITADFPGYAAAQIKESLGSDVIPLFLQGCAGNINPISACLTTFDNCERLGKQLGEAVVTAWYVATPVQGSLSPKAARRNAPLPLFDPPAVEEAIAVLEQQVQQLDTARGRSSNRGTIMIQEAVVEWAARVFLLAREGNIPRTQDFELQALSIGDFGLVGMPGEVFFEYAQQIEAGSPFKQTMVLAYHNGCVGYVPTAVAYPEGGYEVVDAIRYYGTLMMKPESEGLIVNAGVDLLSALSLV